MRAGTHNPEGGRYGRIARGYAMMKARRGVLIVLVAVSYRASERERRMYAEGLGAHADLVYLQDLDPAARLEHVRRADVLVGWNPRHELGRDALREFHHLRLVQLVSAGADHLDPADFPRESLLASNAGAFSEQMGEHVLAMTLALQKRLLQGHAELQKRHFDQTTPSRVLRGSTVGIVGYGGIGRAVANVFRPFGCPILAINRSGEIPDAVEFRGTLRDLKAVFSQSDIVVLTLALTPKTRGLIGREELAALRERAIFINVARADLVDEDALYMHLAEHPEVLAGIDVWWQEPFLGKPFAVRRPLLDLPNVLGSPHNSGVTDLSRLAAAQSACANVLRWLTGSAIHGALRPEDLFTSPQ